MNGFLVILRKEFTEIFRTWRIWVLPGILIVIAVMSPILAELTPALVRSISADHPDVVIQLPDPVATDSYLQFVESLNQIGLLALIITTAGMISGEVRSGTATLVLTKPVSRASFVLAKVISQVALLVAATLLAAAICWLLTLAVFGEAPIAIFVSVTLLWLLYAVMLVGVTILLSVLVNSTIGAAGAGIGVYFALTILAQWGPTREHSPAGIMHAVSGVIMERDVAVLIPVLTAGVGVVAAVAVAVMLFNRRELAGQVSAT